MAKSLLVCRCNSSGHARITIAGKDHLLSTNGPEENNATYQHLFAEWLAAPAKQQNSQSQSDQLLSNELIQKYW